MRLTAAAALLLLVGCSRLNPIAPECPGCLGKSCADAGDCNSGFCSDGVCCNSACSGACDRCDLGGAVGTCGLSAAGDVGAPACAPYLCNGSGASCPTACAADSACASGAWCSGGLCVATVPNGGACARDASCQTGHCYDGVCCDSVCGQGCDRCNLPGFVGTCRPATAGDPGAPSCAPYVCSGAGAQCPTNCSNDANCADGGFCNGLGTCIPILATGQTCARANQCQSGFCVDGVCCGDACAAPCAACNNPGSAGSCGTAPAAAVGRPACAPYLCTGIGTACASSCTTNADCAMGFACSSTGCLVDTDRDGVADVDDCAPSDATRYTLRNCYADLDRDNFFSTTSTPTCSGAGCPAGTRADAGTDCDDTDAGVYQLLTCSFGPDADNDGFHAGVGVPTCSGAGCPDGGSSLRDCDDNNAAAKPGQRFYFATPRDGGSFDYDCDGVETKDPSWDCVTGYAGTAICSAATYSGQRGFVAAAPGCGDAGVWRSCASWENSTCSSATWWYGACGTGCISVDGGTSFSVEDTPRFMFCR